MFLDFTHPVSKVNEPILPINVLLNELRVPFVLWV